MACKPPLGVTPRIIFEEMRMQDLCRALYEYSSYDLKLEHYESMIDWAEELLDRLYNLKFDKEKENNA